MLVSSPLTFNEDEIRAFSENYIMSLELEYLFHSGTIEGMSEQARKNIKDGNFPEVDLLQKYPSPAVLEVGSGIFPIGTLSPEGHKISLRACDALGVQYSVIYSVYGLKPYVKIDFAFVERLTDRYGENIFDIVRMSNALDHCYDPFIGVFEMLRTAKIGGTVRLIHFENESEREHAYGLHQWNITANGENSIVIWRKDFSADLKDILGSAAKITSKRIPRPNGNDIIRSDILKLEDI